MDALRSFLCFSPFKSTYIEAREMAPLLRALDPLPKDVALLSSTHMQILTLCLSSIRESSVLFWVVQALQTHGVDIYASKTPIHRT